MSLKVGSRAVGPGEDRGRPDTPGGGAVEAAREARIPDGLRTLPGINHVLAGRIVEN